MSNGNQLTPEQQERVRSLRSRIDQSRRGPGTDGPRASGLSASQEDRLRQLRARLDGQAVESGEGFFQRVQNVGQTVLSPIGALAGSPEARARGGLAGAGIVRSAFLDPIQGLLQIPGLFTDKELPTDRLDDFIQRYEAGIFSNAEERAVEAGLSAEDIADAKLTGDLIGFISPTVASLKAAGLVLRAPVVLRSHITTGHLVEDLTAGVIFGAALREGESFEARATHALQESAAFGVGRAIVAGLAIPWKGWRSMRAKKLIGEERANELIRKVEAGRKIAIEESEAVPLSQLLTEEGLISNSLSAQIIMQQGRNEAALVQGIIDSSEAGITSGVVRNVGDDFTEVASLLDDFRNQFPSLKFDTVKRGDVFDVAFGSQGLSNAQKAQFKLQGRFEGQVLEKNGSFYEYVDELKDGRLKVRTADGQVTTLKPEGVAETFGKIERPPQTETVEILYNQFREEMDDVFSELSKSAGLLPESEVIKGIRQGTLQLSDDARRAFDRGGAVMHPEELGLHPDGFKYRLVPDEGAVERLQMEAAQRGLDPDQMMTPDFIYQVRDAAGEEVFPLSITMQDEATALIEWVGGVGPGRIGPGYTRDIGRQLVWDLRSRGLDVQTIRGFRTTGARPGRSPEIDVERLMAGDNSLQTFMRQYLVTGAEGRNLLPTPGVATFDDAFEAWAKMQDLPVDAPDFETMKTYFANRVREDFWKAIPDEDRIVFENIRKEFYELAEEGEIPFTAFAHNKGFTVVEEEIRAPFPRREGQVTLKDIMTGREITFGSERVARDALAQVTRGEGKDVFGGMVPKGSHGISGMTGGFDPTDGHFMMDAAESVPTREFLEDMPLLSNVRNLRDVLIDVERATGMPLYSKVFDRLDEGVTRWRNEYEPWANRISKIWKPLSRNEKKEVVRFWQRVEGEGISLEAAVRQAEKAGLSRTQVRAFREGRKVFDTLFQLSGIDEGRYIHHYYSRLRPWSQARGGAAPDIERIYGTKVPPEVKFWAEMQRTGELSVVETDPEIVMQKYARGLFFKREVRDIYEQARGLVSTKTTPKVGDLPKEQAASLIRSARERGMQLSHDDPILRQPIRDVLSEYLNVVRGAPTGSQESSRRFFRRMFEKIGVNVDDRVLDQYTSAGLASMYGAAMGLRPSLTARNAVQTIWTQYTRLGAKHGGEAMRRAFTQEGFEEVVDALAIRNVSAGVPAGDAIFERFMADAPVGGTGPISNIVAGAMQKALRAGEISQRTARKFLTFYSSTDDMNRAWSYWWQKLHTDDVLRKFEAGDIEWDRFLEDGLPFFKDITKREFARRYNKFGREDALRWIGKQGADEAHFIYGVGAQPAWMQKPLGRFLGMFGTWPIWAGELYFSRMAQGTFKQKAAFWARNLALIGAFSNMTLQSGIALWNWIAPFSVGGWAGGPFVDHAIEMKRVIDAPLDQKASALGNLAKNIGRLSLPGQVFYNDVARALDSTNPADAAMKLMLGRPVDEYNFAVENIYTRENMRRTPVYPETTERSIRSLTGSEFPQMPIADDIIRGDSSSSPRPPSSSQSFP